MLSAFLLSIACQTPSPTPLTQHVVLSPPPDLDLDPFLTHIGDARLSLAASATAADSETFEVTLALSNDDARCTECYRLSGAGLSWQIEAGGALGAQYGLADLLERWGYRFPHPHRADLPGRLPADLAAVDIEMAPEQALRALHLHTLHPIEGLWSTWTPPPGQGDDALEERFDAVVDWLIKNRGNRLQWVALDDISADPGALEAWRARTARMNAAARERGITTSLGIQLFGSGNLQRAFDLVDSGDLEEIQPRLSEVTGLGFAAYDLSFGEFFGEDPETFIAAVERVSAELSALEPGAELSAVIHVGDSEEQRVTYEGQDQIYYFLVQYADAPVIPRVHTVMYYNLFDDAGGAYHHEDFSEHRDFLLEQLRAGERAQYFPESAYWVAFDNPVPLYLPLYTRSRWQDMASIRAELGGVGLEEHVLFSSGWEWGYWQADALTLRMGYTLPDAWGDAVRWWFSAEGEAGLALAEQIVALGDMQHDLLIGQQLAAYLAGRDAAMDVGFAADIVAAPDRVTLTEAASLDASGRAALQAEVVAPLQDHAAALERMLAEIERCPLVAGGDPWAREVRDGVAVDLHRTRFVAALYAAVLAEDAGMLAEADAALRAGEEVVARRHAALHDPLGEVLVSDEVENPTIYDYGYLLRAEELCFWDRERTEAGRLLEGSTQAAPGCF